MNNIRTLTQKDSKLVILHSLLVALFMDIKCLNRILSSSDSEEEGGFMGLLYMGIICILFITGLFNKNKRNIGLYPKFILLYIVASYYITVSLGGKPYSELQHIAVFTICSFLLPFFATIDVKLTIKAMMIFPVIGVFKISQIFRFVTDYNEWISMGLSYSFYVPIVATVIYLVCFYRNETRRQKRIMLLVTFVDLLYLFEVFKYGSRGPIVLLLMLVFFLIYIPKNKMKKGVVVKEGWLILFVFLGLLLFFNYEIFFLSLNSLLKIIGVHSHIIDKFIQLTAANDISNGRDIIYDLTLDGILNSPIIGNGFDLFDFNTGYLYPHNFILQMLYDGGIVLCLLILFPAIKNVLAIFKECNIYEYSLLCLLIFAGAGTGLFSGNLWRISLLWLFFGFTFSKSFIANKDISYE